ncbi:MAG: hypothetical protein Q7R41_04135, partial [Phycisphaerales bacterium]|nr:hypothetical protein [Phycisphaerales bacterium]
NACLHHRGQAFPFDSRNDCRRRQTRKRRLAFAKLMAPPQTTRVIPAIPDKVSHASLRVRARLHPILFSIGDCVFLLVIGAVAATVMRLIDSLAWNAVLTWVVGMALAMLAQTILAFAAAPLLGSIETMVPSMVLAMLCPMALDLLEMIGADLGWSWSIGFGAGLGFAMFLFVEIYGVRCRKSPHRLGVRR